MRGRGRKRLMRGAQVAGRRGERAVRGHARMGAGLLALDWAGALGRELMLGCAREGVRAVGEGVGWAGFWLWAGYGVLVFVFLFFFKPTQI